MSEPTKALRPIFGPYDYIKSAEAVAAFTNGVAGSYERGIYWPPLPSDDTSETSASLFFSHGNAGHVFFLTQLYLATKNPEYLEFAKKGAYYIIDQFDRKPYVVVFPGLDVQWTFHLGYAGVAYALIELARVSPDAEIGKFARDLTDKIVSAATQTAAGAAWSPVQSLMGEWGTILFLLYAAEHYAEPSYRELALRAGEIVLALGEPAERGIRYNGMKSLPGFSELFEGAEFPNFEFGAGGAGYTLARLYEASGDQRFLDGATGAAEYLRSIAVTKDGGALIPYRFPDLSDVFYLGFCHGPAGTGRLFYKLYEITGNVAHLDFLKSLAVGLEHAGAPETHSHGYWHTYNQCCGTSAQTDLFLNLWAATGEAQYLDLANRAGRHILGAAAAFGESVELSWHQAFTRVDPATITLDTGYLAGAAGIGSALLHLGLANEDRYQVLRLPDDPFPPSAAL
ncbi:MAG: hypothetical protein LBS98_00240 [Coriobacteriales bacterium]|jgi:lantibiotic modifying enzyme|nr:hypothetical protein [Coriobacteriales bacterium]